jgi:hypothetical protein
MENRRHPRLSVNLPIRFVVEQVDKRESQAGHGKLKNISYGGILFEAEPPLSMEPGHVREFSFFLMPENRKECDLTHFQAQGLVLRIEAPETNSSAYEVAVQFLSALKKKELTIKMTVSPRRRVGAMPKPSQNDEAPGGV